MELLDLRPTDVLTKDKLARKTNLHPDLAETILIDLFKDKVLQLYIRVYCNNEDYAHFVWFNSLNEYYNADEYFQCPECGSSLNWKNARVGFKRGVFR